MRIIATESQRSFRLTFESRHNNLNKNHNNGIRLVLFFIPKLRIIGHHI